MRKGIPALLLTLSLLLCGCRLLPERIPPAGLTVHFIDVGQADCALLESSGEYMLIDGGNREDGRLVVSYLEQQGVEELAAVVCTHAHEDHVGGLPSVLAVYPTHAVYAPTRTYASKVFDDFVYYADQQRLEITIPSPGDSWTLGETSVTVLGPVQSYADPNDTSIILRVEYGDTSFLFTGDMETSAENDMLDYWGSRMSWETDVLKVGHHGSDTSTGYRFLNEVDPDYAVISVGKGNSYGHPPRAAPLPAESGGRHHSAHRRAWHHRRPHGRQRGHVHMGQPVGEPGKCRACPAGAVHRQRQLPQVPRPRLREPPLGEKPDHLRHLRGSDRRGLYALRKLPRMTDANTPLTQAS